MGAEPSEAPAEGAEIGEQWDGEGDAVAFPCTDGVFGDADEIGHFLGAHEALSFFDKAGREFYEGSCYGFRVFERGLKFMLEVKINQFVLRIIIFVGNKIGTMTEQVDKAQGVEGGAVVTKGNGVVEKEEAVVGLAGLAEFQERMRGGVVNGGSGNGEEGKGKVVAVKEAQAEKDEVAKGGVKEEEDAFSWMTQGVTPGAKQEYPEEVMKFYKEQLGVEDPSAWKTTQAREKERMVELAKVEEQYKELAADLGAMPSVLQMAMRVWKEGGDVGGVLKGLPAGVDFGKGADKQDERAMVEAYYGGKVSKEEWEALGDEDMDEDTLERVKEKVKHYVGLSRDAFNAQKQRYDEQLRSYDAAQKEFVKHYGESVDGAITYATTKYPGLKAELDTAAFRGRLGSGEMFDDLFYTKEGLLKPDAAVKYRIAENPEGFIASVQRQALKAAREQAQLEVLNRTPSGARAMAGGGDINREVDMPDDPALRHLAEGLRAMAARK